MIQKTKAIIVITIIILSSGSAVAAIKNRRDKVDITSEDNSLQLNGSIIAEVYDEFFGSVFPTINLSNKYTLEINVTDIGDGEYQVDGLVKIPIEVIINATEHYPMGRYLTTFIFIIRENKEAIIQGRFIDRILRALGRFDVFSEGDKFVEIPFSYETLSTTENASLYVFALGSLTGILSKDKSVFAYNKIDLEFLYKITDIIDITPPITMCILEGEIYEA